MVFFSSQYNQLKTSTLIYFWKLAVYLCFFAFWFFSTQLLLRNQNRTQGVPGDGEKVRDKCSICLSFNMLWRIIVISENLSRRPLKPSGGSQKGNNTEQWSNYFVKRKLGQKKSACTHDAASTTQWTDGPRSRQGPPSKWPSLRRAGPSPRGPAEL